MRCEGRVCWLKRFGPSKVVTEVGLSGLGLPPRALSSIRRMTTSGTATGCQSKQQVARSRSTHALLHCEQVSYIGDRVTTPAGREEQGTSLYSSYTDPPHGTPAGAVAKRATSGVSCRPESPGPGYSGPASLTPSPPGLTLAAGAIAGAVGARGLRGI